MSGNSVISVPGIINRSSQPRCTMGRRPLRKRHQKEYVFSHRLQKALNCVLLSSESTKNIERVYHSWNKKDVTKRNCKKISAESGFIIKNIWKLKNNIEMFFLSQNRYFLKNYFKIHLFWSCNNSTSSEKLIHPLISLNTLFYSALKVL